MIKHICIDWGNTLCPVTGEYEGPMIDWPELSLFDGVHDALAILKKDYPLSIATNAKDSNIDQINAVMARLNCDSYFEHIYTPAEIGVGKESVDYYRYITDRVGCQPDEILMIGDDYDLDIRNACEVGVQTAIYNPDKDLSHAMYFPLQQYEVSNWEELLAMLETPRPTLNQAISWMQREKGSFVIWQHVQTVAAIAYWFALQYRKKGYEVDAILTHRAGLLHDLDKLTPNRPAGAHGHMGAEMLKKLGYAAVGEIVGSHVIALPEELSFSNKESELVFFADKLVKHNEIVPIHERFEDLERRYGHNDGFRKIVEPFALEMQAQLCADIGINSEQLVDRLKADLMGRKTR